MSTLLRFLLIPAAALSTSLPINAEDALRAPAGLPAQAAVFDPGWNVQQALQAEVDGDAAQRKALLQAALRQDPDLDTARWHSGYGKVDGDWLNLEQVAQDTNATNTVEQYRQLKRQYAGSFQGEVALAKWCRRNGLDEQESLHWAGVLQFNPNHAEARL